jgi:hypothetical protein
VPDDDDSVLAHDDRLPEPELSNARGYFTYSDLRDVAGFLAYGIRFSIGQISTFIPPDTGRRTAWELTILLAKFWSLSLAKWSGGPTLG